jgi:hypothetical protein
MTLSTQIRASVAVLMVSSVVFATAASQAIAHVIVKALSDGKSVRVLPSTACSVSQDGTHFTGCSSVL